LKLHAKFLLSKLSNMKKNNILLFVLLSSLISFGQNKAFYKQTTFAYEINKKDTIKKVVHVTFLDSLRNILKAEENDINLISGDKIKSDIITSFIKKNNGKLFIQADINTKGDTIQKLVSIYDNKGNIIENYQILNKDTINGQKRIFNEANLNTKLFNKIKNSPEYYLSSEWVYDHKGNYTESKTYNEKNQLMSVDRYENTYEENGKITVIQYSGTTNIKLKIVTEKNKSTLYFYKNEIGYNYGIKFIQLKGGYETQLSNDFDEVIEMRLYDPDHNLTALMYKKEEKL
jgi:hypothetical protein